MAEENGENGSVNGDVPEIELIIKVNYKKLNFKFLFFWLWHTNAHFFFFFLTLPMARNEITIGHITFGKKIKILF